MKTYGTLYYRAPTERLPRGVWAIDAKPHVMVKVKRMFGRVRQERGGAVIITDTEDVARDIEWFLDRYPLLMDVTAADRLRGQAARQRAREDAVQMILADGMARSITVLEAARPARPYQQQAADLCLATGRLLLTDDVGLGKTQACATVLAGEGALPGLVVCQTHLPSQWERELAEVFPMLQTHIAKGTRPYDPPGDPDVLIVPYSRVAGWRDYLTGWARTIILDEAQELRHEGTLRYEAVAQVADQASYRMAATATPVYNYGIEAYNVISVLDKDALGTREEFIREYCVSDDTTSRGSKVVKEPGVLGEYLRDQGLMLRRTRADVGRELPDVITVVQPVEANTAVIEKAVTDSAELARMILGGSNTERFTAGGQLDMKLRQATGIAKAPYVSAFCRLLLEQEEKIVLAGWHRGVYDLWVDALAEFRPVLYTGSEGPRQKAESFDRFTTGDARVLILSLRSGVGLDGLQEAADVVVFGELDWSPQVHEQVIGRVNREAKRERSSPPVAYYLLSNEGSDPVIAEYLQLKRNQAEPMLNPDGRLFSRPAIDQDRVRMLAESVLTRAGRPELRAV